MTASTWQIEADELRGLLDRHATVTVLDVRTNEDHAEWAIPGSLHVDAYTALKAGDPEALAGLDLPDGVPVVTVCGAGKVSLVAAEQLRARGYDARSLVGGMKAWSLAWNSAKVPVPGSAATRRAGAANRQRLPVLPGREGRRSRRDRRGAAPEVYQGLAAERGWTITRVLDTHVHADHLSRARLVAEATGANLVLPGQDRVSYPFDPIRDGDVLPIGDARLTALRTPGHTPESTCYLLDGGALFTGDTLFLAGVGRPDLEASAEEARERARLLWASLQRLLALPPDDARSAGAHQRAGRLRRGAARGDAGCGDGAARPCFASARPTFVATILGRIPPTPPNHAAIVAFNEAGELPAGDPTELEAGANRCAVS